MWSGLFRSPLQLGTVRLRGGPSLPPAPASPHTQSQTWTGGRQCWRSRRPWWKGGATGFGHEMKKPYISGIWKWPQIDLTGIMSQRAKSDDISILIVLSHPWAERRENFPSTPSPSSRGRPARLEVGRFLKIRNRESQFLLPVHKMMIWWSENNSFSIPFTILLIPIPVPIRPTSRQDSQGPQKRRRLGFLLVVLRLRPARPLARRDWIHLQSKLSRQIRPQQKMSVEPPGLKDIVTFR